MPVQQNEFPMPANLRPAAPPSAPATLPTSPVRAPLSTLAALMAAQGSESFRLDSDLRMALADMQQASGEAWQPFLEKACNEALRFWMGR